MTEPGCFLFYYLSHLLQVVNVHQGQTKFRIGANGFLGTYVINAVLHVKAVHVWEYLSSILLRFGVCGTILCILVLLTDHVRVNTQRNRPQGTCRWFNVSVTVGSRSLWIHFQHSLWASVKVAAVFSIYLFVSLPSHSNGTSVCTESAKRPHCCLTRALIVFLTFDDSP